MSKKALGKGLGAIIKEACDYQDKENLIQNLSIDKIYPSENQPRKDFDEKTLTELSCSIKTNGIIQPIIVYKCDGEENRYYIIAGERRWRASRLAGMSHIPCIVRNSSREKQLEMSLIENLQREDLNPIEEGEAIQLLMSRLEYTQEQVASRVGKNRSTVANLLRLLKLPPQIKHHIKQNKISEGHARALINIEDINEKLDICDKIIKRGLSVRQTESLVKDLKKPKESDSKEKDSYLMGVEEKISMALGAHVEVVGKKRGSIKVFYRNRDELEKLERLLTGGQFLQQLHVEKQESTV